MTMEMLASLAVPLAFFGMWAIEARRPARQFESVPRWRAIGIASFVMVAIIGSAVPFAWSASGVLGSSLLDLSPLGAWAIPIGLLTVSFVTYWWHRAQHRFDFLWRTTHQLHHSALRVDIAGAYLSHPLEIVAKTSISSVITIGVLGLAPWVASIVTTTLALISLFEHWNIHTPRWLGWLVQRPEMHVLHHEREVHGRNYGDVPLWDLLFGTFVNPEGDPTPRVGFARSASLRWLDMLRMRDVVAIEARAAEGRAP
jgi:sterol desaturase/sphingolipid hydroxylase (fatty acid hydroxylase superfamily)